LEKYGKQGITYQLMIQNEKDKIRPFYYTSIIEGYDKLGAKKMKALEYRKKAIGHELNILKIEKDNEWKIFTKLNLKNNQWYSGRILKNRLNRIYGDLGIKKTAKGNDVNKYFEVEPRGEYEDGKKVQGFYILESKFKAAG